MILLLAALLVPRVIENPIKYNPKWLIHGFLEKTFGLANTAQADRSGYGWGRRGKNLVAKIISGEYPAELDTLSLDIPFSDWLVLSAERDRALKNLVLRDPTWVNAQVTFRGRTYDADIRLKGHQNEHRYMYNRWSLRIKIDDDGSIGPLPEFSLVRPSARQFPSDQLFHAWHKDLGGLSPNFIFTRVRLNGESWGVMMLEEHVTSEMLELNGRKEAAIFKLIGEESEGGYYNAVNAGANTLPEVHYSKIWPILYKEDKYSENERYLKHFSYALRKFKELEAGVISPWDILDFESNARAFILAKAWGSGHTIGANNSRFYINPYFEKTAKTTPYALQDSALVAAFLIPPGNEGNDADE